MSRDIQCPYCHADLEVCHDDGFGYEEDVRHEMQCGYCEKHFTFTTTISFSYHPEPAPCLNGAPHELKPVISYPQVWPDWKRCVHCEHEVRGTYKEPPR